MSQAWHRFWNCYKTFFEMCFAPQRRALFRHLNFQERSERGVLCTFWLRHVLSATKACTFSTSQLPKVFWNVECFSFSLANVLRAATACTFSTSQLLNVLRSWGVLYILTWKCASRHNGVQLVISHLTTWLRTRRFSKPTFWPLSSPLLSSSLLFSSLLFSSLLFSSLLFSSLLWLVPPLLFMCPYCRKFDF